MQILTLRIRSFVFMGFIAFSVFAEVRWRIFPDMLEYVPMTYNRPLILLYICMEFSISTFLPLFWNSWQRISIQNGIACKILTLYVPPSRATSVSWLVIFFQSHFRYCIFAVLFIKEMFLSIFNDKARKINIITCFFSCLKFWNVVFISASTGWKRHQITKLLISQYMREL